MQQTKKVGFGYFKKASFVLLLFHVLACHSFQARYKIGLLVVATSKYTRFIGPLLESADKYFCNNHKVTYFIFTDGQLPEHENVITIYQEHLGWPRATLMRAAIYTEHKELLQDQDYLFACDADMLFVDEVGDEILSNRVGTQHPSFVGRRGTYEKRPISKACVGRDEGKHYFAGAFYGGSRDKFLKGVQIMAENIKADLSKNIIAVWHDESHLNRYFIDYPPTRILSPSYCYPECRRLNYKKKLLTVNKNHPRYNNG